MQILSSLLANRDGDEDDDGDNDDDDADDETDAVPVCSSCHGLGHKTRGSHKYQKPHLQTMQGKLKLGNRP